jgi:LysM repeat protein
MASASTPEESETAAATPQKEEALPDTAILENETAVAAAEITTETAPESGPATVPVDTAEAPTTQVIAKKEEIEYEVVQPEPVVENARKEDSSTVTTAEQPTAEPHQAEIIAPVAPVAANITEPVKETAKVKTPEKVALPVEEPKDEFARLKARLDKVVYASDNAVPEKEEPKKTEEAKKPEEPKKEIAAAAADKKDAVKFYTVKKGDTAFGIAKKHNITMRQLMDWNKLDFETIKVGQQLRVKQ